MKTSRTSRRNQNFDGSIVNNQICKAPHLSWIQAESILDTCLVVEEEPGVHEYVPISEIGVGAKSTREKKKVFLIRDRMDWPHEFTSTDAADDVSDDVSD